MNHSRETVNDIRGMRGRRVNLVHLEIMGSDPASVPRKKETIKQQQI